MSSEDLVSPITCPPSWPLSALKALCTKIGSGATPTGGQANYQETRTNYALVRSQNVFDREFSETGLAFITDDQAGALKNVLLEKNDILLNITGDGITFGRACLVPQKTLPACVNQHVCIIRLNPKIANPGYVVSYLTHPTIKSYIESFNTGGSRRAITKAHIESFVVPLPPLTTQNAIADLLGVIDSRIGLLRETNATLEAIAQALFKSWFVDFDPVCAKQAGQQPEGMDEATAALFPDRLVESALGAVPVGWTVVPLCEVMDFKEGPGIRNWQYTNSDHGTRFINIRCIRDGDLLLETANRIADEEANGKYAHFHLAPWDIVVSTSGTLGRSAIVRQEHLPLMLNTSVIRFRPVEERTAFSFIYQFLNGAEFQYKLESMASGSVQKNFGPMHLKQIQIVCPPFAVLQAYEDICRPIYEQIIANRAKAQTLATLRDTLLPRLISGQLRIPTPEPEPTAAPTA